jgi:DNA-binding MarR family transcriptional regulator
MITPERLGERYIAVHHRMFRAVNDEMSGCGLSLARTKVLMRLHDQGPTRQSVLAAEMGLAPHSITDIVDGLERLGLAERRPDATDRRAKLVGITESGEICLDVATGIRDRLFTQIFGALGEADRATLLRLLDRLDEAAQQAPGTSVAPVPATRLDAAPAPALAAAATATAPATAPAEAAPVSA